MIDILAASGITPDSNDIKKFERYIDLILEYNKKFNLTAITNRDDIILKHFADCLFCSQFIESCASVIDIGSGAGFPGVPLAIVRKDIQVTLMDSLQKRVGFLNIVIDNLELSNTTAIHCRAEEIGHHPFMREKFDVALSRAVACLSVLAEYSLPLVRVGGTMVAMKGRNPQNETGNLPIITELGGDMPQITIYNLPNSDITHSILHIKKLSPTPLKYPRHGKKLGTLKLPDIL